MKLSVQGLVLLFLAAMLSRIAGYPSRSSIQESLREALGGSTMRAKGGLGWVFDQVGRAPAWIAGEEGFLIDGIIEGPTPRNATVDLNTASSSRLQTLPGITPKDANQIINARPFGSTDELVTKGIISEAEYRRIRELIKA